MSLRQLKFKPKLQLNPSVKSKTDENITRSAQKEVFNSNSDSVVHSNSCSNNVNKVLIVEAVSIPKSPVKNESKDSSSRTEGITYSEKFSSPVNCDSPKVENISVPNVPATVFTDSVLSETAKSNSTKPENNPNDICQDKINVPESQSYLTKPEEDFVPPCCSDSGDNEVHVLNGINRNQNHLINYDVLKKISSPDSQQVVCSSNDISKNINNDSILKDTETNENTIASCDLTEKASESEKTEIPKISVNPAVELNGLKSTKISRFLHKPKLGFSKTVNTIPCESTNAGSNYEEKNTKRRKNDTKRVSANSNKVGSLQRANFKPNLATLGKIKRPEKFTMSSYSKMESLVKEQFIKKFGKEQEPDTSKLTMMDLIFYNPSSNPMSQSSDKKIFKHLNVSTKPEKVEENNSEISSATERKTDEINNKDDAVPVPQLTISADGKVIVAQDSLVIKPSQDLSTSNFETVIDGEFKKKKPVKNPNRCGWSHVDTVNFYKALNSLGCDFETMQTIFPGRSRRNLKSKFKKEEKLRGSLINKVLSHHSEFDLTNVVRELEIDTIYKSTIKNYGRDLSENGKRPGRRKSLSSVVAGKSSGKDEEDSDDDFTDDDEFPKRRRKADPVVISKISNVLGLNDKNDSTDTEIKNQKVSKSDESDISTTMEPVLKRNRRKWKENVESDTDIDSERHIPSCKKVAEFEDSENRSSSKSPRILRKRKKTCMGTLPNKSIIIRLEDLIDFNEGVDNDPQPDSKTEINENHIVINTNIEFEHVKYTRYISYNPNNLENPIEINETVAHVD